MNQKNRTDLKSSLKLLEKWLPGDAESMLQWLEEHPDHADFEEDAGFRHYCLFSFPLLDVQGKEYSDPSLFQDRVPERIILLVYDHSQIIADCSAIHCETKDLHNEQVTAYLRNESDWMDLEHYTLCGTFFSDDQTVQKGQTLLYSNAYVTVSYRRKGIFTRMIQMMRDHALRNEYGNVFLYSIISLDPDIACYGPDSSDEPYFYSMEQDEPKRLLNAEIMRKLGFMPVRLEETEPSDDDDGSRLWFALRKEEDRIIDTDEDFQA